MQIELFYKRRSLNGDHFYLEYPPNKTTKIGNPILCGFKLKPAIDNLGKFAFILYEFHKQFESLSKFKLKMLTLNSRYPHSERAIPHKAIPILNAWNHLANAHKLHSRSAVITTFDVILVYGDFETAHYRERTGKVEMKCIMFRLIQIRWQFIAIFAVLKTNQENWHRTSGCSESSQVPCSPHCNSPYKGRFAWIICVAADGVISECR